MFWLVYETFTLCQPFNGHFLFFSMKPSCLSGFWTLVWPIFRPSMISQLSGSWRKSMKTHWLINFVHTWKKLHLRVAQILQCKTKRRNQAFKSTCLGTKLHGHYIMPRCISFTTIKQKHFLMSNPYQVRCIVRVPSVIS